MSVPVPAHTAKRCGGGTVPQTLSLRGGSDVTWLPVEEEEDVTPHGWQQCWRRATVGSPIQVPLKPVLMLPLVALLIVEIKKESQYPLSVSSGDVCPHPLGKICCVLQWRRSYPRLFKEDKSECLYELQSSSQSVIPLN